MTAILSMLSCIIRKRLFTYRANIVYGRLSVYESLIFRPIFLSATFTAKIYLLITCQLFAAILATTLCIFSRQLISSAV
jgi:uncharacterized membrane protein YcgQ (UPF0703/DUF1980 family)